MNRDFFKLIALALPSASEAKSELIAQRFFKEICLPVVETTGKLTCKDAEFCLFQLLMLGFINFLC
jgi:hypothetical protein